MRLISNILVTSNKSVLGVLRRPYKIRESEGITRLPNFMTKNRTSTERQLNKLRIAEDKARAARWASQRRLQHNQDLHEAITAVEVTVEASVSPANTVLQDLLSRRTALVQELKELDIAIAFIQKTYAR